jgi:hypothetical protein
MESNKTAEPANVNDDDLANEKPIVSQPRDVHTVGLNEERGTLSYLESRACHMF